MYLKKVIKKRYSLRKFDKHNFGPPHQLCSGLSHFGEELALLEAAALSAAWIWEIFGSRPKECEGRRSGRQEGEKGLRRESPPPGPPPS